MLIAKLRSTYREIAAFPAGERFRRYHQRRKDTAGRRHSAAFVAAGLVLVVTGFFLSLPPLMPGFLLWLPGLALMASQWHSLARALDRSECLARNLYRRVADRREN